MENSNSKGLFTWGQTHSKSSNPQSSVCAGNGTRIQQKGAAQFSSALECMSPCPPWAAHSSSALEYMSPCPPWAGVWQADGVPQQWVLYFFLFCILGQLRRALRRQDLVVVLLLLQVIVLKVGLTRGLGPCEGEWLLKSSGPASLSCRGGVVLGSKSGPCTCQEVLYHEVTSHTTLGLLFKIYYFFNFTLCV